MSKSIILGAVLVAGQAIAADTLELEPCINGGVSASGLFVSQAQEDAYRTQTLADLELEPCINGGVSASGSFASQAEEAASRKVARTR